MCIILYNYRGLHIINNNNNNNHGRTLCVFNILFTFERLGGGN